MIANIASGVLGSLSLYEYISTRLPIFQIEIMFVCSNPPTTAQVFFLCTRDYITYQWIQRQRPHPYPCSIACWPLYPHPIACRVLIDFRKLRS